MSTIVPTNFTARQRLTAHTVRSRDDLRRSDAGSQASKEGFSMKTRTISVVAAVFVPSCLASTFAAARDWLHEPERNAPAAAVPHAMAIASPYVNYGTRAQVRIIRPDGVYQLGSDYYQYGTEGPGVTEQDHKDD
jgi:hypothetical protein